MKCENCGYDVTNLSCIQCGHYNRIINTEENQLNCPDCNSGLFDGWDCNDCGYKTTDKEKKVKPRILGEEETKQLKIRLGIK